MMTKQFDPQSNMLETYFKDHEFNPKKESLKEKNLLEFFKV